MCIIYIGGFLIKCNEKEKRTFDIHYNDVHEDILNSYLSHKSKKGKSERDVECHHMEECLIVCVCNGMEWNEFEVCTFFAEAAEALTTLWSGFIPQLQKLFGSELYIGRCSWRRFHHFIVIEQDVHSEETRDHKVKYSSQCPIRCIKRDH